MACRQRDHQIAEADEVRVGADQQPFRASFSEGRERSAQSLFGGSMQDMKFQAHGTVRLLNVFRLRFGGGIVRVQEHADLGGGRNQLAQKPQPLRRQRSVAVTTPFTIATEVATPIAGAGSPQRFKH